MDGVDFCVIRKCISFFVLQKCKTDSTHLTEVKKFLDMLKYKM